MRTSCKITSLPFICSLLLSACASRPLDVAEQGGAPILTGRAVVLAQTSGGEGASTLAEAVMSRLRSAGVATAQAGERAAYLLEVVYSERPWRVGAYAGAMPDQATQGAWVAAPQPWPWWAPRTTQVCTLAVRVVETGEGREAYRVRASARGRGAGCGHGPRLTDAVAAKLAPSA